MNIRYLTSDPLQADVDLLGLICHDDTLDSDALLTRADTALERPLARRDQRRALHRPGRSDAGAACARRPATAADSPHRQRPRELRLRRLQPDRGRPPRAHGRGRRRALGCPCAPREQCRPARPAPDPVRGRGSRARPLPVRQVPRRQQANADCRPEPVPLRRGARRRRRRRPKKRTPPSRARKRPRERSARRAAWSTSRPGS